MMELCYALTFLIVSADPVSRLPTGSAGPATDILTHQSTQQVQEEKPTAAAKTGERYLLLDNNTIVPAQNVEELADQYRIERAGAKMGLPKSRVRFVGDSLESVYRYRAERVPIHDAHMRCELAQWCFNQGLVEYANAEAYLVIKIDPANEAAKRILKMCDSRLHPQEKESRGAEAGPTRRPRDPDPSRVVKKFKAAYGQDLFNRYKSLEPLLTSSCGNAACHGGIRHEGPFRMFHRTDGSPNDIRLTSRNLTSMLDSVDYRDPLRSPILYKALERHGASSLPPLGGVQDPTYVALQEWVVEVTQRWSSNEIELDPGQFREVEEMASRATDSSFGSLREEYANSFVRKTGRPIRPLTEPGDDINQMRATPMFADDAPAESTPGFPHDSPPPRVIPDEPKSAEKISANEMTAPVNTLPPQSNTRKPGALRTSATRIVEMVRGRPRVKQSVNLTGMENGTREGMSFDAATPPINLVPSFDEMNQSHHHDLSGQ